MYVPDLLGFCLLRKILSCISSRALPFPFNLQDGERLNDRSLPPESLIRGHLAHTAGCAPFALLLSGAIAPLPGGVL